MYYMDPENEEVNMPTLRRSFDHHIASGRAMQCCVLTLIIGANQSMGDVQCGAVCPTDDFAKSGDVPVHYVDPENEEVKIVCSSPLLDRRVTSGPAMMSSVRTDNRQQPLPASALG